MIRTDITKRVPIEDVARLIEGQADSSLNPRIKSFWVDTEAGEMVVNLGIDVAPVETAGQPGKEAAGATPCGDVLRAWTVEGRHPPTHREAQRRLRDEWPALANALDRLARESAGV